MVVVKGFGIKPMMLLTNCAVNIRKKQSIWKIVEYYLTRWKCDESYRYIMTNSQSVLKSYQKGKPDWNSLSLALIL